MKAKKVLALVFALCLTISCMGMTAFATENTEVSSESLIKAASDRVRELETVTDGQSSINHEEISSIFSRGQARDSAVSGTIEQEAKLELASTFSSADGMSLANITTVVNKGLAAFLEAESKGADEDSYRHFTWNFRSAKSVGGSIARIFTINYEWSNVLLDEYDAYYDERFSYYYDTYYTHILLGGLTTSDVMKLAAADADDYIVELRNTLKAECRESMANFSALFSADNVMDFWNNLYGRNYADSYASMTNEAAFALAKSNGVIISSSAAVTSYHISTVYNSNWWYTGT